MRKVLFVVFIIIAIFLLCFVACTVVERYAKADEREELREPLRSINTQLPDDGLVGSNLATNNQFYDLTKIPSATNDQLATVILDRWYKMYSTLTRPSSHVLLVASNGNVYQGISYIFAPDSSISQITVTLSVDLENDFFFGLRGYNGTDWVLISAGVYNATSDFVLFSRTFSLDSTLYSRYNLQLLNVPVGSFKINWAKIEAGAVFTGFVPLEYSNYGYADGYTGGYNQGEQDGWSDGYTQGHDAGLIEGYTDGYRQGETAGYSSGYQQGYDVGYLEGIDVYSYHSDQFAFNNVEHPYSMNIGWAGLYGLSDFDPLNSATFGLTSYWYQDRGLSVLSFGTYFLANDSDVANGFAVWISPLLDVTFPSASPPSQYILLVVLENVSYLTIVDPDYPSSWNPVEYPRVRAGVLTCQYGYAQMLEQVGDSSYNLGFNAGRDVGYANGFTAGEMEGYNQGLQVANTGDFLSLVSAIIDAPVRTITSMLDFDILGLNMLSVVKVFITFGLFIFVVKFLIGKFAS